MKKHPQIRRKKGAARLYTPGELNELIGSICHPLAKVDKGFILVGGILHGLVEQNPPVSVRKFVKVSLPRLIKQLEKEAKKQSSAREHLLTPVRSQA